jgi:adenylate cyclase
MPDLEAVTVVTENPMLMTGGATQTQPTKGNTFSQRWPLATNRALRLGRSTETCELAITADLQVSAFHATLTWTGTELTVERRPGPPDYPQPTRNPIKFGGAERDRFAIGIGGTFEIGETVFTLRESGDTLPAGKADQTPQNQMSQKTRAELVGSAFHDPHLLVKLYELMTQLESTRSEGGLFAELVDQLLTKLPSVDVVAVVEVCPSAKGEVELKLRASEARKSLDKSQFAPSRKLVKTATTGEPKNCRYEWPDASFREQLPTDATLFGRRSGTIPWAVCAPFHDGSRHALYLAGFAAPEVPERASITDLIAPNPPAPGRGLLGAPNPKPLDDCQRFAELAVQLAEKKRAKLLLEEQLRLALRAWPTPLRSRVKDVDEFRALLSEPKVTNITVLFCDLRGYSKFAEEHGSNLREAFAVVQRALEVMCTEVTGKDGIVAGFRGDAILGFWGWPDSGPDGTPDQIERAASAAQRIFERLSGMDRKCGIGVTHGPALVGRLGAHDLAPVDLYGPVVNLAFRLEEMTKHFGVGIVVSDTVANYLRSVDPAGKRFRPRDLGTVKPRGVNTTLTVSELPPTVDLDNYRSWVTQPDHVSNTHSWNLALKLFTEGKWTAAREKFAAFPGDPVATYLIKWMRDKNYQAPTGWTGTYEPVALNG